MRLSVNRSRDIKLITFNLYEDSNYCIWHGNIRVTNNVRKYFPNLDLNLTHQLDGFIVGSFEINSHCWPTHGVETYKIHRYLDRLRERK